MESRLSSSDMSFDPPSEASDEQASFSPSGFLTDDTCDPADIVEKKIPTTIVMKLSTKQWKNLIPEAKKY